MRGEIGPDTEKRDTVLKLYTIRFRYEEYTHKNQVLASDPDRALHVIGCNYPGAHGFQIIREVEAETE